MLLEPENSAKARQLLNQSMALVLAGGRGSRLKQLTDNRAKLDELAAFLYEKETITGAEMVAIIQGRDPATADSPLLAPGPETPAGAEGSPEVPSVPAPQLGGEDQGEAPPPVPEETPKE